MSALLQDSHIARASHNMMAYRFFDEGAGVWRSDNDEDGEDAAGGRMSMLLEMMQVRNAVVVVTRWFGGVLLGPSRFKLINNAARQVILAAGLSERDS
jgi:putative IMPACT (imprinted ancient) family translation regulator